MPASFARAQTTKLDRILSLMDAVKEPLETVPEHLTFEEDTALHLQVQRLLAEEGRLVELDLIRTAAASLDPFVEAPVSPEGQAEIGERPLGWWGRMKERQVTRRKWLRDYEQVRQNRTQIHQDQLLSPVVLPLSDADTALLAPEMRAGLTIPERLLFELTRPCLNHPELGWHPGTDLGLLTFLIDHGAKDRSRHLWSGPRIADHGRGSGQYFSVIELAVRRLRPEILACFPEPRIKRPKGRVEDSLMWSALMCPLPYHPIHRYQENPGWHIAWERTFQGWERRLEETVEWVLAHEDDTYVDHVFILARAYQAGHPHRRWLAEVWAREKAKKNR